MNSPYWFEAAIMFGILAVGNILFAHFETETPRWRRVLKVFVSAAMAVIVSAFLGRGWFFGLLAVATGYVIIIHAWWLPKNGVNGWTAEPRERYYALRGWKMK
jgi:hypothetical protein